MMQEITYEDGTKTKEFFKSMFDALEDTKQKAMLLKPIKKVTITMVDPKLVIPKKRNRKK